MMLSRGGFRRLYFHCTYPVGLNVVQNAVEDDSFRPCHLLHNSSTFSRFPFFPGPGRHPRPASAYCTTRNLSSKLSPIRPPILDHGRSSYGPPGYYGQKAWDLYIDDTPSGYKQTIDGFGAAVTDATVVTFNQLDPRTLDRLLDELMTPYGANFGLMRHTIGPSDLSPDPVYTYDDNGGEADPKLKHFDIGDRGNAMAILLAKMKAKKPNLKILGSPWSSPGWMKMNGVIDGNTTDNNLSDQYLTKNQTNYSSQFAQYFVKYIRAFQSLGANVDAITLQNEPLNSQSGYPTMYIFDYEAAQLANNYVGPALRNAGLGTSIWAYDHNTDVPSYPQTVLDNAGEYVDTVAWHCYAGSVDWKDLTVFKEANPGVKQYMTECWTPVPDASTWHQAANFTIGPLQNWAEGVMAWTLAANSTFGPYLSLGGCHECRGLVTIEDDGRYTFNMAYYLIAQFSKFMPRGSIVLDGQGSSANPNAPGIQSVASLNPDGTRSVVIMNTLGEEMYVRLRMRKGESWSGVIPAASIVTWILPPAKPRHQPHGY